ARRRADGAPVALLFLDLDSFKVVNDSLVLEVGDDLLRAVAGRLAACLPPSGTLARLGGDEFTVLLEGAGAAEARTVAGRILAALDEPFTVGGHLVRAGASIGVAMFDGDAANPSELLRNADLAMYEAKQRGKSRYEVFHPRLAERAHQRLVMEAELREALHQHGFVLYFQPEVELATSATVSWEALPRWPHPTRGLLRADDFVSLAEETGLIHAVGRFTLEEACLAAAGWTAAGNGACVSVNVSERQLLSLELVDQIESALDGAGLPPQRLTIEVPERVLIAPRDLIDALRAIRSTGARLALDDFGSASSSFAHLKRLPFQIVKLHHSLVAGLGETSSDAAIVGAVVSVAHALGMEVTAEGVETTAQLDSLREIGCDRAQGSQICAPIPLPEPSMLQSTNR
ncbi:MAG: putative bifunctional diguanylate cyclase/phosphodiesterase, partial [Actinomycetota bacterium]